MTDEPRLLSRRLTSTLVAGLVVLVIVAAVAIVRLLPTDDAPAAEAEAPAGIPLIVFAVFGPNADEVYVAPANAPEQRTLVDTIEHAPGWGMNPAPAMSGSKFAYTVFGPDSAARQDAPAEIWLMDLDTGERARLARDADLLIAPRFTDDGSALIYRRSSGSQQEIVRIDLTTSTRYVVHAERTTFGIFPIGYAADGGLVYARLSTAGTDILSVHEGRTPTLLFHASDHIARDWQLAPDGRSIAYLEVEEALESILHRARVSRLASGEPLPLSRDEDIPLEQYGPTWTGDGSGVAIGQQATPDAPGSVIVQALNGSSISLPAPERGFDVPTAWSPDGRFLAARSFTGVNSAEPGDESAVILDVGGARYEVPAEAEVIFIGWIASA
jgi:hypothetical protein